MKKTALGTIGLFLFIGLFHPGLGFTGQVVTKDITQWAKQAIADEKSLPAVPSSKSVAVLYYQNLTGNESYNPLQKGLSVMLTTDLAKLKDFKVVERARLQAILEEIELGKTGLVDKETVPRIGKLVGARFLSGGDILKGKATQLRVDPRLLNVSNQKIVNQAAAEGNLEDLIAIEKQILFEIVRLMDITLTPDQKAELEKPVTASIPALMLLFKGIDASDHGNYAQAADLYNQALVKDPNLVPAKEALNEINTLGLTSKSAETPKPKESTPEAKIEPKSGGAGKTAAVILGLAAVGAGGYYAATALKDDEEEEENPPPPPPPPPQDTTPPTVTGTSPSAGSTIGCYSRNEQQIVFYFSEAMNSSAGRVLPSDTGWNISNTEWTNNNTALIMSWQNTNAYCSPYPMPPYPPSSITFNLVEFSDVAGNPLSGIQSFFFNVD